MAAPPDQSGTIEYLSGLGQVDRVVEAIKRSPKYMQKEAAAQLAALMRPETLWAFALMVGVWAGLQFLPAGPLVDAVMYLAGGYLVSQVFGRLKDATLLAARATTDSQIEQAAQQYAACWVEIGVDTLVGLATSRAFKFVEAQILRFRPLGSGAAAAEAARPTVPEAPPKVPEPGAPVRPPAEPSPAPRAPVAEPVPAGEPVRFAPDGADEIRGAGEAAAADAEVAATSRVLSAEREALTAGRRFGIGAAAVVDVAPAVGDKLDQALNTGKWVALGAGLLVLVTGTAVVLARR